MRVCVTRWKAQKAIVPEENNLVTDEELEQLYRETNFSMPHEAQIYNILVMAFHRGARPEMMERLDVESIVVETRDDTKVMKCTLGTMKNLQGTLANADAALFRQEVVAREDTRLCPIAAFERQRALVPSHTGALFRATKHYTQGLGDIRASYRSFRGAANRAAKC
jgi:hypothetical protein